MKRILIIALVLLICTAVWADGARISSSRDPGALRKDLNLSDLSSAVTALANLLIPYHNLIAVDSRGNATMPHNLYAESATIASTVPAIILKSGVGQYAHLYLKDTVNRWLISRDGNNHLRFYNYNTLTYILSLLYSGQVGLGTSTPDLAYTYHIVGNGRFDGSVVIAGNVDGVDVSAASAAIDALASTSGQWTGTSTNLVAADGRASLGISDHDAIDANNLGHIGLGGAAAGDMAQNIVLNSSDTTWESTHSQFYSEVKQATNIGSNFASRYFIDANGSGVGGDAFVFESHASHYARYEFHLRTQTGNHLVFCVASQGMRMQPMAAAGVAANSYKFILMAHNGSNYQIGDFQLVYGADPYLRVSVPDDSSVPQPVFDVHDTVLAFVTDNAVDIGAPTANRPAHVYAASDTYASGAVHAGGTGFWEGDLQILTADADYTHVYRAGDGANGILVASSGIITIPENSRFQTDLYAQVIANATWTTATYSGDVTDPQSENGPTTGWWTPKATGMYALSAYAQPQSFGGEMGCKIQEFNGSTWSDIAGEVSDAMPSPSCVRYCTAGYIYQVVVKQDSGGDGTIYARFSGARIQ